MPVPAHALLSFRGHFGTTSTARETWSFGLRFQHAPVATFDDLQAMATQARANFVQYILGSTYRWNTNAYFDEVRGYYIGTDGRAVMEPAIATGGAVGGTGGATMPWQNALAISLEAPGFDKRGKRGRFYLPSGHGVEDTGLISLQNAQDTRTAVTAFLEAVSNRAGQPDFGWTLSVVGNTGAAGTLRPVNLVRVGRVVDTQRRRRRQVAEAYLEGPLST